MWKNNIAFFGLALSLLSLPYAYADVQISGLRDFNFANLVPGTGNQQQNQDLCVLGNSRSGYQIMATGNGPQQSFALVGTGILSYQVFWNNNVGTVGNVQLRPNVPQVFNSSGQMLNCPNGKDANLQIQILANDIEKSSAGAYAGSLTITIAAI